MKKLGTIFLVIIITLQTITLWPVQSNVDASVNNFNYIFDAKYYADAYPDLKALYGYDYNQLFNHFVNMGMKEGRQGNAEFNVYIYKNRYKDLAAAFGDNLEAYYYHYMNAGRAEGRNGNPQNVSPLSAETKDGRVTISIAGDCTLGEYKGQGGGGQFKDYYNMFGPAYFFSNVQSIFAYDDITFVNLEGPITDYQQVAVKTYPIRGDSRNVKCLTSSSIEVVNLSNNHIYDCGNEGFEQTKNTLSSRGIGYCGEGNVYTTKVNGITVSFFGYQGWSDSLALKNQIAADLAASTSDIKIVEFHWGVEREYVHNSVQESLAHFTIDAGADLVVGAHPHVVQDVEMYNNKLICYSMGNFSFGANKNPADKDTFILSVTFSKAGMDSFKIIPCKISSTNKCNDYRPTIVFDSAEKARILRKMGL